jgi:tetratricopeptide (TPR) repeat protein
MRYICEDFPSAEEEKEMERARIPLFLNRAACYLKITNAQGQVLHSKAISDLLQVVALDAGNAKAYFRLGQAYHAAGDHEDALSALRKANELVPGDKLVLQWIQREEKVAAEHDRRTAAIMKKAFN